MVIGLVREGIDPAEESPAHDPLHTVIDPDLIRDHDLRAIPPCHAQMLHIGSRYLGPVGRRPGQPHDDQTYQARIRLSSSQRKLWVAPMCPPRARLAAELLASATYASTAARVQAFVEQGGGCRATFFNYRRKLTGGKETSQEPTS